MSLCVLSARFLKKKVDILETTSVTGANLKIHHDIYDFILNRKCK